MARSKKTERDKVKAKVPPKGPYEERRQEKYNRNTRKWLDDNQEL
jgi:hypothetical protein